MHKQPPLALSVALILTGLSSSTAHATDSPAPLDIVSINRTENSLGLEWSPVNGAVEYTVFEEVAKTESLKDPEDPIYRGESLRLSYEELDKGEVARLRMLALDEDGDVLARSLVRTSTLAPGGHGGDVTWVADSSGVEISIDEVKDDHSNGTLEEVNTVGARLQSASNGIQVADDNHLSEGKTYVVTAQTEANSAVLGSEDNGETPGTFGYNWNIDVPGMGKNESFTLEGEKANVLSALADATYSMTFAWDAFIEDPYIPLPALCLADTDTEGDLYMGGDGRGFGMDDVAGFGTSRVNLMGQAFFMQPRYEYNQITQEYEFAEFEEPFTRNWLRNGVSSVYEMQVDGSLDLIDSEIAPIDELEYEELLINQTSSQFRLTSDASLPLCQVFGFLDAPAINVFTEVTLNSDGTFSVFGGRDAAPNHQATIARRHGQAFPPPTQQEFLEAIDNPFMRCVERHRNLGFIWLAAPPEYIFFDQADNYAPDCSY